MTRTSDRWIQLGELAELFGLSEESIKRFAKKHGFPLRRLTPYATPGVLESELFSWLKAQPLVGRAVRASRVSRSRNTSQPQHRRSIRSEAITGKTSSVE